MSLEVLVCPGALERLGQRWRHRSQEVSMLGVNGRSHQLGKSQGP